jgi:hypothetical protein
VSGTDLVPVLDGPSDVGKQTRVVNTPCATMGPLSALAGRRRIPILVGQSSSEMPPVCNPQTGVLLQSFGRN